MRLSDQSVSDVQAQLPDYDRKTVSTGIVHLGTGAFHRAHQAVYIDSLLAGDNAWGIVGASLRTAHTADALNAQDGLYTLIIKDGGEPTFRVIGSISHILCAAHNGTALIEQMAEPNVRIVSLTVTEKGYCHTPATGRLNTEHADIQYDLANPEQPCSAPGFLVAALNKRRLNGAGPFSVLSCDNLPHNGSITQQVVTELARLQDPDLADWITSNVTFPSTMVDRIVPATTSAETALVKQMTGADDTSPVASEGFCQWVIEDNFCAGRPDFEAVGVVLTHDVVLFETMKLRLLNGSHSALAYIGLLRGHTTVAEAMDDEYIASFVKSMMEEEVSTTLVMPKGIDLPLYCEALLERFRNPDLNHALAQIAMDGSQKLPQRILAPIRELLENGKPITKLSQVVSAWLLFIGSRNEADYTFALHDPLATELRHRIEQLEPIDTGSYIGLLLYRDVFGDTLADSTTFRDAVEKGCVEIMQ